MNVSVEASVALPARLRPTPAQVCDWYERTLRGGGFDVARTGPQQLEVTAAGGAAGHVRMLGGLSSGDLEVADTADGFEVTLRGRPSTWMIYLDLAALGVFGSTLAISSSGPPWISWGLRASAWPSGPGSARATRCDASWMLRTRPSPSRSPRYPPCRGMDSGLLFPHRGRTLRVSSVTLCPRAAVPRLPLTLAPVTMQVRTGLTHHLPGAS